MMSMRRPTLLNFGYWKFIEQRLASDFPAFRTRCPISLAVNGWQDPRLDGGRSRMRVL